MTVRNVSTQLSQVKKFENRLSLGSAGLRYKFRAWERIPCCF